MSEVEVQEYDERRYVKWSNFKLERVKLERPVKKPMPKTADVKGDFWEIEIKYEYNTISGPVEGTLAIEFPPCWCGGMNTSESQTTKEILGKKISPCLDSKDKDHGESNAAMIVLLHKFYIKVLRYICTPSIKREILHLSQCDEPENWKTFENNPSKVWQGVRSPLFYGIPPDPNSNPVVPTFVFASKPLKTETQKEKLKNMEAQFAMKYKVCKVCPKEKKCRDKSHPRGPYYLPHATMQRSRLLIQPVVQFSALVITGASKSFRITTMSGIIHDLKPKEKTFAQNKTLDETDKTATDIGDIENTIQQLDAEAEAEKLGQEYKKKEFLKEDEEETVTQGDIANDDQIETF